MAAVNYATLRKETPFRWFVGSSYYALLDLVDGITQDDLWEQPDAMIDLLRRGRPMLTDLFGDDIILPIPATPAISYGHVHALGAELIFPKGGDVSHTILYDSLEAAADGLKKTRPKSRHARRRHDPVLPGLSGKTPNRLPRRICQPVAFTRRPADHHARPARQ